MSSTSSSKSGRMPLRSPRSKSHFRPRCLKLLIIGAECKATLAGLSIYTLQRFFTRAKSTSYRKWTAGWTFNRSARGSGCVDARLVGMKAPPQATVCTFGGCDKQPTETNYIEGGQTAYAEYRSAEHAKELRWQRRRRIRLSDMEIFEPVREQFGGQVAPLAEIGRRNDEDRNTDQGSHHRTP
jgi:hypothetical protein